MAVQFHEVADGRILNVKASGKLTKADYQHLVPEMERLIQKRGKIRTLFEIHDFHGWEGGAMWEDLKLDLKHFNDIERLAIVGEKRWEHEPFTMAKIRFFNRSQAAEARAWIAAEMGSHAAVN